VVSLKVDSKIKLATLFVALTPFLFVFSVADAYLIHNEKFNASFAAGVGAALLMGLLSPHLFMWIMTDALKRIQEFCTRVKKGDYTGFIDLPNEATYSDDEDISLSLMRDMNWMAHQIKIREGQLKNTITELHRTETVLLAQKQILDDTNARLMEMAMTDHLTGLSNRRHFFDHLEQETYRRQRCLGPVSLLILDIDHFKQINDCYGHQCGDRVLAEFAHVLRQNVRKSDLAARVGGEEFAILLSNTGVDGAVSLAHTVLHAIQQHHFTEYDDCPLQVTCSIGVCGVEETQFVEPHILYRRADDVLYIAKRSGRNCVRWHLDHHEGEIDQKSRVV
jgi:diguanylate cyclase (GGDEF)-like protein